MRRRTIHYAGPIRTATTSILAGWAACCSGAQAEKIREAGANSRDKSGVTCRKCVAIMNKSDRYAEQRDYATKQRSSS